MFVWRTVIEPFLACYVTAKLDIQFDSQFIFEGSQTKHVLISCVYGEHNSFTVKVVNDSNFFITFKKGKKICNAEADKEILPSQAQFFQSANSGPRERSQSQEV